MYPTTYPVMRTLVILNPSAGGRSGVAALRRRLEERIDGDFTESSEPGAAVGLARDAARSGYDRVVAVGGDGTVREVAEGLYRGGAGPVLGIVPAGTGNDLAHGLGLPVDVERALPIACGTGTRALDLIRARAPDGTVETRFAANAAVAGFCGRIARSLPPWLRRRVPRMAYPLAALSQLRDLGPYRLRLEVDGEPVEIEAHMLVIANGPCAGGRVPLAPGADPGDGALDLVVIRAVRPTSLAALVPRVLTGRHLGHPAVLVRRATSVRVESDRPMWINLDGDTWTTAPAALDLVPDALRVAAP